MNRQQQTFLQLGLAVAVAFASGCIFSPDEKPPEPDPPPPIPAPTSPAKIVEALQVIYNDKVRNASERLALYQNLFPPVDVDPGFKFFFIPDDVPPGEQPWWGISEELQAHDNMFKAQERRDIFSLELSVQHLPAEDSISHDGWKDIEATNVFLRLMFNPQDGLEVNGGRATFRFSPGDGRWFLNEWVDLPRAIAGGGGGRS